ncbi:protein of unknown function [Rhodovastum atsumiense]|nr:protein of unknown function [Rhodovastum atsumiense]
MLSGFIYFAIYRMKIRRFVSDDCVLSLFPTLAHRPAGDKVPACAHRWTRPERQRDTEWNPDAPGVTLRWSSEMAAIVPVTARMSGNG